MFKDARVGDKVWDTRHGWGNIISIYEKNEKPLNVEFKKYIRSYRFDGKIDESDVTPRIFWNEFKIPKEAYIKLEKDSKVLVWNSTSARKAKRYFSHFDKDGFIYTFENGCTSWTGTTTHSWNFWEIVNE